MIEEIRPAKGDVWIVQLNKDGGLSIEEITSVGKEFIGFRNGYSQTTMILEKYFRRSEIDFVEKIR